MALSTGLLLKVLAGLGATAGAVSLGVIYGVDRDPHLLKLPFEARLKVKVGDFFGNERSDKLCKKQESSDQNLAKYTCTESGTKLKEALKFTTDGTNELKVKEALTGQKIEIKESDDTNNFPFGIMLVLENGSSSVSLQENETDKVTFKSKTFPEFKLENGKFKHAWTIKNLGEKVGLECKGGDKKICTLEKGEKINVFEDTNKKVEDVTFSGELKWEEDVEGHNQGFKLIVDSEIKLLKGGSEISGAGVTKISGTNTSYEIKHQESLGKWYLSKHQ